MKLIRIEKPAQLDKDQIAEISAGHCPDCHHRGFVIGPMGGLNINLECGGCGGRFNVAFYGGHAVMGHRL